MSRQFRVWRWYAFVGKNGKYYLDNESSNGISAFKDAVKKAYPGTSFNDDKLVLGQCDGNDKTPHNGELINENGEDHVGLHTMRTVSAYGGNKTQNMPFKSGMTIGFEINEIDILKLASAIKLTPLYHDTKW